MISQNTFSNNLPRYLVTTATLMLFLYFGKTLFIPLFYGLFIAIILYPVCKWLECRHFSRSLAIATGLFFVILLFALLLWVLALQFNAFRSDIPALKSRLAPLIAGLQNWLQEKINISVAFQNAWINHALTRLSDNSGILLAGSLNKIASGFFNLFIIPVFAALFLYNRNDFILFLEKVAGSKYHDKLHLVLHDTVHTYFRFINGMIVVYIIVGILNSAGLLALGIKHAILFGFISSIMTIIPYFGIFISALLPVTIAWITKDSIWYPLGVIIVFTFVQYLEANVIFPRVVASQLNVSTWTTLVAIIAGGILWGVSGMILFIPLTGILKMATDRLPEWEALNILLSRKHE